MLLLSWYSSKSSILSGAETLHALFPFCLISNSLLCSVRIYQWPLNCGTLCSCLWSWDSHSGEGDLEQTLSNGPTERSRAYKNLLRDPLRMWQEFHICFFFHLVLMTLELKLYFLSLCWHSHCVHPFFSRIWWAPLWSLFWTLYEINHLFLFH